MYHAVGRSGVEPAKIVCCANELICIFRHEDEVTRGYDLVRSYPFPRFAQLPWPRLHVFKLAHDSRYPFVVTHAAFDPGANAKAPLRAVYAPQLLLCVVAHGTVLSVRSDLATSTGLASNNQGDPVYLILEAPIASRRWFRVILQCGLQLSELDASRRALLSAVDARGQWLGGHLI